MTSIETAPAHRLRPVAFDIYRDIHKGIRSELFAAVTEAGRIDPSDELGVTALAGQVQQLVEFLLQHAEHEDGSVQPVLEVHAPSLAAQVADDHEQLDRRMVTLVALAGEARRAEVRRGLVHELYLELAGFTGTYLLHQDLEEREVAQALEHAVGLDGVLAIDAAIHEALDPQTMTRGLASMLPAMNVDDRADLLGGMKAHAPAEVFEGVWSLAKSVLSPVDHRAVATRLGVTR